MINFAIISMGVAMFFEGFSLSCRKNRALEKKTAGAVIYITLFVAAISVLLLGAALLVGNLLRRVLAGFSPFFGLVAALVPSFLVLSVALKNEYLKKDGATDLLSLVKFYAPVIFAAFMCGLSLGIYGLSVAAFWATIGCPCGVALGLLIKAEKSERLERTAQFLAALCYFAAGVSLIVNDMLVTWR